MRGGLVGASKLARPAVGWQLFFVSFFAHFFGNLRQIGLKAEICRKAKSHFSRIYDKFGKNDKYVVNFTCLDGLGRVTDKSSSVPTAHAPEMTHPIYDKNAKIGESVVNPKNGTLAFTSYSAKTANLS